MAPWAAAVQANEDWQQSGTCLWRITDGLLEVKPASGSSGILDGFDWKDRASEIASVRILPGVTAAASCYGMFEGCSSLKTANLTGLDTSSARTMGSMFKGCSSLVSVDFGGMDTSSVQSMSSMFNGCEALTSLDLSEFDTTNVNSMDQMFYYCESLESLDLSGFKTGLVETMNGMFGRCKSLSSLDITGLDLRDATDLEFMFIGLHLAQKHRPLWGQGLRHNQLQEHVLWELGGAGLCGRQYLGARLSPACVRHRRLD